ncbi:cysteine proteinase [Cylindrobasidium torrendii FP15055 ss-10]|uniref:Cysteine proteinase n=1 Tax=Cylindrobasidium torrendii FP15055 ss-10 TaxID=1314674 RepID=A0A0D7BLA0_9AGAR|nr:cysteine proteinase [Cylindrobasidium torrendii FP15055 ss-10]
MGKPAKAKNAAKSTAKLRKQQDTGGSKRDGGGRRSTRSSNRGRLISDGTTSTKTLEAQLREMGLYPAQTEGDGNCLFRALSDQLHGSPSKHLEVRQDICQWIEEHADRYEGFVDVDEFGTEGLKAYLAGMRTPGTYGGHMELSACAHMLSRDIKVVQPGLVYVLDGEGVDGQEFSSTSVRKVPLYVAYHDWEHYSSVRNLRGPHAGLPEVQETARVVVKEEPREDEIPLEAPKPKKITKVRLKLGPPPPEPSPAPSLGSIGSLTPLSSTRTTPQPASRLSSHAGTPPPPSQQSLLSSSATSPAPSSSGSSGSSSSKRPPSSPIIGGNEKRLKKDTDAEYPPVHGPANEEERLRAAGLDLTGELSDLTDWEDVGTPKEDEKMAAPAPPGPNKLTRRQRKKLGLPKERKTAGTIKIPGGRFQPKTNVKLEEEEPTLGFREVRI